MNYIILISELSVGCFIESMPREENSKTPDGNWREVGLVKVEAVPTIIGRGSSLTWQHL